MPLQPENSARFAAALERIDAANAADPVQVEAGEGGRMEGRELVHARRFSHWVERLRPDASEALRLAARAQHLCRWEIPRQSYPMTRAGYLRWRADLKAFHARRAGEILRATGYDEALIERVADLNLKKNFPQDPEVQTLEDALCLTFLELQFAEFATRTDEAKMIGILQKTWKKMSSAAHAEALKLPLGEQELALVTKALSDA